LTADFAAITQDGLTRTKNDGFPVIYAGWSMGAVQAVAAAGDKSRPQHLRGWFC
jgi:phosphatidylglycerol lysyltransferase